MNCGCPSIETGGAATYGASLMRQPSLTRDLVHAIRDATPSSTAVSLKCVEDTLDELEEITDRDTNNQE